MSGESLEGIEDDRDVDKSKSDDSAVLQALYDGAPLSSVFHHDLAEGKRLVDSLLMGNVQKGACPG